MDRSPVSTILGRLPQIMRARYGGGNNSFWIAAFNDVLADIEMQGRGPDLEHTAIVPISYIGITNPVPAGLARVHRARLQDGTPFRIAAKGSSWVPLDEIPATASPRLSGFIAGEGTVKDRSWLQVADALAELESFANEGAVISPGLDEDDIIIDSWVVPADGERTSEHLLIAKPGERGEFRTIFGISAGIVVHLYSSYLAVDGTRALARVASATSLSPLPPRWDPVIAAGIEALGEEQTKKASPEAVRSREKYEAMKQQVGAWASSERSSMVVPGRLSSISMPRRR